MARRSLALLLVTALLGSTIGIISAAVGPITPAGADAVTERPVYGRNEAVVLAAAQITFERGCPSGGVPDWVYPVADIYVIKGAAEPSGTLIDASGEPNTVFGVTGGGVFDEVIGYTTPRGALGPGTYAIAIDECQDGKLGAEDTLVPDAFKVVSKVVGPELTNIGGLKAKAQIQADRYQKAVWEFRALLLLSGAGPSKAGMGYGLFKKSLFGVGIPNPGAITVAMLGSKGKHYAGIAADPPDPAFDQATALVPTAVPPVLDPTDPLDVLAAEVVGPLATSAALTEALLHSMERYQGAWSVRDGEWQLAHARAMNDHATLLADQVVLDAPALDQAADVVAALPAGFDAQAADLVTEIDDFLLNGPTPAERAQMANEGVTQTQLTSILTTARADLVDFSTADLAADLRAIADEAPAEAAELDGLAANAQGMVGVLEADVFVEGTVPEVDAGGPYTGTVGSPLSLDASGTTGPAPLTFDWDLDGDGEFDDATGATPTATPTTAFTGLAAVKVTSGGEASIGYAPLDITGGPVGPSVTNPLPAERFDLAVAAGSSQAFSVEAGGDAPTVAWHLDGVPVATGTTFSYNPALADVGLHLVEAVVTDASGQKRQIDWYANVTAPDADGDLYWSTVDCNDAVATTYPGAPEILDGVDNDCDPTSPDGGVAPVVAAGGAITGTEGTSVNLSRTFTHPSGSYTATIDWGDGTTTPGTVTGKTVTGTHVYADDAVYSVNVCVKAAAGKVGCKANTATIANATAGPKFSTLFNWIEQERHPTNGVWTVAPDGLSVYQSVNGDPTFFMSDQTVPAGVEAGVTLEVETTGDDDLVGFALGLQPGFVTDPDADYLLLDWKQGTQGYIGCGGDSTAEEGLALSRIHGAAPPEEMWAHIDCPPFTDGVVELARGNTLGTTGWDDNTAYNFRIRYTPTRVQIWVDEVLEFDLAGTFPMGRFGFYNYSQSDVRYSGYQLVPGDVVEGTPRDFSVSYDDPGTADTHTGSIAWGDGTPDDLMAITETGGEGAANKGHQYLDDGAYDGEVCITDDDDGVACQQFPVAVANAAPVVYAGRDRVTGTQLVLDESSFTDPGVLDTHTVSVDWGDGNPVENLVDHETMGEGYAVGAHTYAADGSYTVEICVTDDDGATTCDDFEVEVLGENAAPVAASDDDVEITEGSPVTRGIGFTDANPGDTHTATIDWGDGSAVEPIALQSNGLIGTGAIDHVYPDDGEHLVTVEVCDDSDECDVATSTVTVVNADPTLAIEAQLSSTESLGVTVVGDVGDVGVADTHSVSVDWGDGSPLEEDVPVTHEAAGGGIFESSHAYSAPGTYDIEVCVTDDDDGSVCEATGATPVGLPPGPPTDVSAIGGDGNARVRWRAPQFTGGVELLEYEIETQPGGAVITVDAPTLNTIVASLVNDSEYTFRVRVSNEYGWGPWSVPSNLTRPRPPCPGAPFSDVGATHPFCPEIKWMADTGVSVGYPDNTYRPAASLSRQHMAAFAYRLMNPDVAATACTVKPFTDIPVDHNMCAEISWMKAEGISTGKPDGSFGPTDAVSRQAMAAFLYRLSDSPEGPDPACDADEFSDVAAAHAFCGEIHWVVNTGVAGGYPDGTYDPNGTVSRQAMAAFIFRYNIFADLIP